MYSLLLIIHSWLRWFVLAAFLFALLRAVLGILNKGKFGKMDNLAGILSIALGHTQLLLGFILYFISPLAYPAIQRLGFGGAMKDKIARTWSVEHATMMFIAVILVQVGRSMSKKQATDEGKHKRMAIFVAMALALIFLAIPADRLMLFRF